MATPVDIPEQKPPGQGLLGVVPMVMQTQPPSGGLVDIPPSIAGPPLREPEPEIMETPAEGVKRKRKKKKKLVR